MAIFYLDASTIVKRYRPENGTDVVDELVERPLQEDRFYTSFLSVLEVTSAIHRLAGSGHLDHTLARILLGRFHVDLRDRFRTCSIDNDLVRAALAVVEQHHLRAGDAIHLATSLAIVSLVPNVRVAMMSSDRQLIAAAQGAGLAALDPTWPDALAQLVRLRGFGTAPGP